MQRVLPTLPLVHHPAKLIRPTAINSEESDEALCLSRAPVALCENENSDISNS